MLFRLFKIPSQKASEHGKARLAYEEMVRRAERRLLQLRSESQKTPADPVQATEEVAKELFHGEQFLHHPNWQSCLKSVVAEHC